MAPALRQRCLDIASLLPSHLGFGAGGAGDSILLAHSLELPLVSVGSGDPGLSSSGQACSCVPLACVPSAWGLQFMALLTALLTGLGARIWVSRMGPGVGDLGWDTSDPVVIGPAGPPARFLPQDEGSHLSQESRGFCWCPAPGEPRGVVFRFTAFLPEPELACFPFLADLRC